MKVIRPIILLALTLLVLVSSTGISVGMHLCGGELSEISLFGGAADCPMERQKETLPPCHQVPDAAATPADCCDDHTFVLENQEMASDTKAQLLAKQLDLKFVAAAVKAILLRYYGWQETLKHAYALYASPPIARDIPVLVQSFLI